MTREQQRRLSAAKKELERHLKTAAKQCGYKRIDGYIYKTVGEMVVWVYHVVVPRDCVDSPADENDFYLRTVINLKPHPLDDIFWEIFGMKDEWQKKPPFSFHVNGAFAAGFLEVYSGYEPVGGEITEEYVISQLCRADERVDEILREIPDIASFERKLDESGGLVNRLEKLLCRISFGDFGGALDFLESEKSEGNSGMYHSISGGSFYDMAEKYCKDKLKE